MMNDFDTNGTNGHHGLNGHSSLNGAALPSPRSVSLRDVLRVLFKRKAVIISLLISITGTVALGSMLSPRIYQARAKLLLNWEDDEVIILTPSRSYNSHRGRDELMTSEVEILKSYEVASRVVDMRFPKAAGAEREHRIEVVRRSTSVDPVKKSSIMEVGYEDENPIQAVRAVSFLIEAYQQYREVVYTVPSRYEAISGEIETNQDHLRALRRTLGDFRTKQEIVNLEQQKSALLSTLTGLESDLFNVQRSRVAQETRLRESRAILDSNSTGGGLPISSTVADWSNSNILQQRLFELEIEKAKLLERYTEEYDQVVAIDEQIKSLKGILEVEVARLLKLEQAALDALLAEESMLKGRVAELRARLRKLPTLEEQFTDLSRGIQDYEKIHSALLQKREEERITDSSDLSKLSISILSPALVPSKPIKPQVATNVMLAVILSLFLGTGLAYFLEFVGNKVRTPQDVEDVIGLPVLGSVRTMTNGYANGRLKGGAERGARQVPSKGSR